MITTVTLSMGALRMARSKVIVKHLDAIENLGSIDLLCSDKTGACDSRARWSWIRRSTRSASRPSALYFLGHPNSRFEIGNQQSVRREYSEVSSAGEYRQMRED